MTEKLYLTDSYINICEATILDIIDEGDTYSIVFDKTPFFPGGGGQPADKGCINDVFVVGAYEKDGIVYHTLKDKDFSYKIGDTVELSVYYDIRFDRMRAHTGEHIISGIAHNKHGVNNVGFHMDDNGIMTVDFDKYIDSLGLQAIEFEANKCVMRNLKINVAVYSVADAANIEYRSKLDFTEDVRIVDIDGIDKCACCAPHLRTTGEVGFIKILSSASHRGGVRITLMCGEKAYWEFEKRFRQVMKISALLCSKHDEAHLAVEELLENNKSLKYEKECIKTEYLEFAASKIQAADTILEFFESFSIDDLRIINNNLKSKCKYISLLFSGNDSDGYCYCVFSEKLKLDRFVRELNMTLNGTGGGRGVMIQGKVKATLSEITKFVEEMKVDNYANA